MSKTTPLIDFFNQTYNIPHYQRGYRWTSQEVNELLDDLWAFCNDTSTGDFYCLQPIVLQKASDQENVFDVIDGQQRLTTLYLLLCFLEDKRLEENYKKPLYKLNFKTRKNCIEFLEQKKFKEKLDTSNIDFYHLCKAYETIENWFAKDKHKGAKGRMVYVLCDEIEKGKRNVRFIRYEIEKNVNPIDVFIRLNIGKIPLTDAELVKALLLQGDKYDDSEVGFVKMKLYSIATEWDKIEYALQNKELWYFLSNKKNTKPTHIELIFDLIAEKIFAEKKYFENKKPQKHSTFLILNEYLKEELLDNKNRIDIIEDIWKSVNEYFEYFNNWFLDRTLYHYIGFILSSSNNSKLIDELIEESKSKSKSSFVEYLKEMIGVEVKINKESLSEINYEDDYNLIHRILLLHNITSTLKCDKENARFPFSIYKDMGATKKWSLEHIEPQNPETKVKKEYRNDWVNDHLITLKNLNNEMATETSLKIESQVEFDKMEDDDFDAKVVKPIYDLINNVAQIATTNVHTLHNLCLIDSSINSKLSNSVFDVKREIIRNCILNGEYIPEATRNVFMKAYTSFPMSNAYWSNDDRNYYYESIESMINEFKKTNNQ